MSSQGCPEIGKLHKCKLKTCPTSCACLSRWSFFYSHFPEISKSITTSFVNYISIKIPLRRRYNNTLFIILQQRKAYLLLTATHSTWRLRKRERGKKKPALKHFTEDEEGHFFQCCRKKKVSRLTKQSVGGSDQNLDIVIPSHPLQPQSLINCRSQAILLHKHKVISAKSPNCFCGWL